VSDEAQSAMESDSNFEPRIEVVRGSCLASAPQCLLDLKGGAESPVGSVAAGLGRSPVGEELVSCESRQTSVFPQGGIGFDSEESVEQFEYPFDRLRFTKCREPAEIAQENRDFISLRANHVEVASDLFQNGRRKIEPEHGIALGSFAQFEVSAAPGFEENG
jgi:hypothetical protein